MAQGKVFEIPKMLVWESYHEVRKNKGAPGCDGQTIAEFDKNRDKNLYKIWNRLSSGSYFPPPVLEKRIPKENGAERILKIVTMPSSKTIRWSGPRRRIQIGLLGTFASSSYEANSGTEAGGA